MKKFLLFSLLISHFSFAQKLAVPLYSAGQVKFYDVVSAPATLLGTFNVVVAGTTYSPNGICFYGNEMFITYDGPSSDGFLHFKGVSVSGGTVTVTSGTKISTGTVTTQVVLDAAGNLFVGCGFGANRAVKKYTRDGSGNYSFLSNLAIPAVINNQWYNGIGGLAMDASGNLWASDLGDNRVLKWTNAAGSPVQFSCAASPSFCQTQFQNTASQNVYPFSLPEGLVFDASGNLWIGNNNDGWGPNTNSTGGSLLKLNAAYLASGGNFIQSNITIYSTAAAKFGGLAKSGNEYYVNDQGNFKIWRINTATGALTDMSIAATYPGNGQVADVPCSVFAAPANPTASGTSINSGQTATLTASNCAAGQTYKWKQAGNLVSSNAAFTTPALNSTTNYTAHCVIGTCESSGLTVTVTVNVACTAPVNPTSASANPSSINSGQTSTLTASGCAVGMTYRWKQGGLQIVASTASFTTAALSSNTTYTAHCVNGTCESSGIPVVVSVNAPAGGVTQTGSISVTSALQTNNPRARTFTFRLPNATPDCNRPLLIALHGDGGNGAGMMSSTGFNAIADAENFIAVYPNSLTVAGGVQWNKFADGIAGSGDNGNDANAADDEKFIADLIDYFYTTYGIDRSKVYVTGHSGGGFMTYALAISNQTKNKIAAIAPVAASLWGASSYINTQFGSGVFVPTPLLHLHSPTDGVVPFPTLNSWTWPLASFSYATCTNAAYTTSAISTVVDKHTFCGTGNKVILMALKQAGLGHGWPSTANSTYNGSQEIWNFMKDYSKGTYTVPNPTVSPMSVSINSGQSTTLTASGCTAGFAYKWNTGATTAAISVSPIATTTYTAFCTYGNTCQSSGTSATVTVNTAGNTHSIVSCSQLTPSPATFRVGTAGTNSIKVFLNVTAATTLTLTATGLNFTGSVTQTFNAPDANAFVWLPINYNGGGLAGNRSIVISSSEAGVATCTKVVEVLNPPIFTFSDCFSGTLSGTFVAGTPSTGSLMVNIIVSAAGPATIQVTGFSSTKIMGSLTTNLTMGQTSITIPVNYDGTGVVGDGDQTYLYSTQAQGLGTIPGNCYGPFYTLVAGGSPCVSTVNVNGLVNPPPYTANQIIQASQYVIAGNIANPVTVSSANSNKLTLQAGKSVTLNPGFTVSNGAVFIAKIEDCVASAHQTFYTQGKDVYASNGQKIVIRGVNYPVMDDWDFPASDKITEIEKSGANAVRLQWYINQNTRPAYTTTDLDNLLTKCKNNRMVPILELHDVTCAEDMSVLNSTLVPWWTSPAVVSVLNNHKKYVIINLANELGKYRWANIYSGNAYNIAALNAWKNAYKTAITAIRAANLKMPIMIDGTDCGSDLKAFHQVGQEIIDHDPEHNIIFSAHAYWQYYPDQVADLNAVVAANVPLVLGEIANFQSADGNNNCDYDLSDNVGFKYQDFLTYLQTNQMGWLAWTWVRDNCSFRNMTNNNNLDPAVFGKYNTLTTFGNDIVNNPTYGIKNTAIRAAAGAF